MTPTVNFGFLVSHDPMLVKLGAQAERYFREDPAISLFKLRQFAELLSKIIAARHALYRDERETFEETLRKLSFARVMPKETADVFHFLRKAGNAAVHEAKGTHAEAMSALKFARQLGIWFHRTYGKQSNFNPGGFIAPPDPSNDRAELRAKIDSLETRIKEVEAAAGRQGNIPFELAQKHADIKLREREFGDAVSRSLREGRILALIAGDGIREGVQSLTELVNRSATKAFTFGLIEIALYEFAKNRFAIQPRVLAATETITRQLTILKMKNGAEGVIVDDIEDEQIVAEKATNGNKNHLRAWWQPIIDQLKLDDPEQEPAFWLATNNLVLNTPFPGIQIKAYAMTNGSRIGLFLSGPRRDNVLMLKKYLKRERAALLAELPKGTEIDTGDCSVYIYVDGPDSDHEKRAWIMKTMNAFVNVLRPRLKKWYTESRA